MENVSCSNVSKSKQSREIWNWTLTIRFGFVRIVDHEFTCSQFKPLWTQIRVPYKNVTFVYLLKLLDKCGNSSARGESKTEAFAYTTKSCATTFIVRWKTYIYARMYCDFLECNSQRKSRMFLKACPGKSVFRSYESSAPVRRRQ